MIRKLAEALRVREDEVEAVLRHDARRARATVRLQRRGFLGALAAVAAAPLVPTAFVQMPTATAPYIVELDGDELVRQIAEAMRKNLIMQWNMGNQFAAALERHMEAE